MPRQSGALSTFLTAAAIAFGVQVLLVGGVGGYAFYRWRAGMDLGPVVKTVGDVFDLVYYPGEVLAERLGTSGKPLAFQISGIIGLLACGMLYSFAIGAIAALVKRTKE